MTNKQRVTYNQVIKCEEMSENAFLMAWNDYFSDKDIDWMSILAFAAWLVVDVK